VVPTKSFCDLVPLELELMVSIASARTQVSTTRALRVRASVRERMLRMRAHDDRALAHAMK